MRATLLDAMRAQGGVMSRAGALRIVDHHILDRAASGGVVVRPYPGVFVLRELADDVDALDRAALAYVPGSALSHTTGLRVLGVVHRPIDLRRHLSTGPRAEVRGGDGLVVHRQKGFRPDPPAVTTRSGKLVVCVERAIIESWPWLDPGEQRGAAIAAVQARLTTGQRLLNALNETSRPPGAATMRWLFERLALGCLSELELWGHDQVFSDPSLPRAVLQHVVQTNRGRFVLDRAHLPEMVGVELDGAAWHGSTTQRERDVRRDAALAAAGWLIVRFTHARLREDPAGCRRELRAILEARRRQLRIA